MDSLCEDKILDRWMLEWNASRESSVPSEENPSTLGQAPWGEMDENSAATIRDNFRRRLRPFDGAALLEPGEIRLLSSGLTWSEQPVYLAILDDAEDPLIVPFSPFHTPATPYELSVDFGVLSVWHAARVDRRVLSSAWTVKKARLSELEVQDALEMLEAYRTHTMPASKFAGRMGARMSRYSADPRRDYLRAVETVLAPVETVRVVRTISNSTVVALGWPNSDITGVETEPERFRLAADDSRPVCFTAEFKVPAKSVSLQIASDPAGQTTLKWNVFDEAGFFSDALKGFSIVDAKSGAILCHISGPSGELPSLPPDGIALLDPSGCGVESSRVQRP
jgi:hypothetical protein